MRNKRTAIAFALAPLGTLLALAFVCAGEWILQIGMFEGRGAASVLGVFLNYLAPALLISYTGVAILGIPAYLLVRQRREPSLGLTVIVGALLGSCAAVAAWPVASFAGFAGLTAPGCISLFLLSGVLTAAAFWVAHRAPNSPLHRTRPAPPSS